MMLDAEQIDNWQEPRRAVYDMGAQNGLRIVACASNKVLLHIDPCARTDLRKLGREVYGMDTLRLVIGGWALAWAYLAFGADQALFGTETDPLTVLSVALDSAAQGWTRQLKRETMPRRDRRAGSPRRRRRSYQHQGDRCGKRREDDHRHDDVDGSDRSSGVGFPVFHHLLTMNAPSRKCRHGPYFGSSATTGRHSGSGWMSGRPPGIIVRGSMTATKSPGLSAGMVRARSCHILLCVITPRPPHYGYSTARPMAEVQAARASLGREGAG